MRFGRRIATCLATSLLSVGAAAQATTGNTGTIQGKVTDVASGRVIAEAQLAIISLQRGVRASELGVYRMGGVPAGTYQLKAIRIGFEAQSVPVTVRAGEVATVNFTLKQSVTQLDVQVVTATGETQRRREQGTNTSTISVAEDVPLAAQTNFSSVLASRTPGVNVTQSGGSTGTGSRIRIRGANSISLSNDPLLIIDGVRVNSGSGSNSIGVGGQTPSRFDDLNPDDLESVEIIKGPAGVALYGLQAANGVIQVRTKRGRNGAARWSTFGETGQILDPTQYPDNYWQTGVTTTGSRVTSCNIDLEAQRSCTRRVSGVAGATVSDTLYQFNPLETKETTPIRDGWRTKFGANLSGGTEAITYFFSGDLDREQGVIQNNQARRINTRANVVVRPTDKLSLDIATGYLNSTLTLPQNDNNSFGAISGGLLGRGRDCGAGALRAGCNAGDTASRGYFNANVPASDFFAVDVQQEIQRFTTSANVQYQFASWLKAVGVTGIDILSRFDSQLIPNGRIFISADLAAGQRNANRFNINTYTSTGTLTATYNLLGLAMTSSGSMQYTQDVFRGTTASGIGLIPGTKSLATTSRNFVVGETNQPFITFGGVVRQQVAFRDRLFIEGGIRTDRNSAFGVTTGFQPFPYASASYVISDESWFPKVNALNSLRFRGAFGVSGTRPGFRDAVTTLGAVTVLTASGETPAVTVNTAGNATLKPEKVTEYEGGFELTAFGGTIALEGTYFSRETDNALVARPLPPSLGNAATQFANIGQVSNSGFEGTLRANLMDRSNVKFNVALNVSTLRNRLNKLGTDIPPFFLGASQRFVEGFPAAGYWERPIINAGDFNGDGIISRVNCATVGGVSNPQVAGGPACEIQLDTALQFVGGILPKAELGFTPELTLFKNFRISANINHRAGAYLFNNTFFFRCQPNPNNCRELQDRSASVEDQIRGVSALMGTRTQFVERSDFWRVREVSASATAPQSFAKRLGVRDLRLTVAGTNVLLSSAYSGFDPEVNSNAQANFTTTDFLSQPPVRRWTARLDFNF
jgi:TonB-dependent starch-binding outer membrane protein SusC